MPGRSHLYISKAIHLRVPGERMIVIQASGNLATTQAVIGHIKNQLELKQEPNILSLHTMFDVAELVGSMLKK